jgi:hypothetical protein
MASSRQIAEQVIIAWLDRTVGVTVSEHVDHANITDLLDELGYPYEAEHD